MSSILRQVILKSSDLDNFIKKYNSGTNITPEQWAQSIEKSVNPGVLLFSLELSSASSTLGHSLIQKKESDSAEPSYRVKDLSIVVQRDSDKAMVMFLTNNAFELRFLEPFLIKEARKAILDDKEYQYLIANLTKPLTPEQLSALSLLATNYAQGGSRRTFSSPNNPNLAEPGLAMLNFFGLTFSSQSSGGLMKQVLDLGLVVSAVCGIDPKPDDKSFYNPFFPVLKDYEIDEFQKNDEKVTTFNSDGSQEQSVDFAPELVDSSQINAQGTNINFQHPAIEGKEKPKFPQDFIVEPEPQVQQMQSNSVETGFVHPASLPGHEKPKFPQDFIVEPEPQTSKTSFPNVGDLSHSDVLEPSDSSYAKSESSTYGLAANDFGSNNAALDNPIIDKPTSNFADLNFGIENSVDNFNVTRESEQNPLANNLPSTIDTDNLEANDDMLELVFDDGSDNNVVNNDRSEFDVSPSFTQSVDLPITNINDEDVEASKAHLTESNDLNTVSSVSLFGKMASRLIGDKKSINANGTDKAEINSDSLDSTHSLELTKSNSTDNIFEPQLAQTEENDLATNIGSHHMSESAVSIDLNEFGQNQIDEKVVVVENTMESLDPGFSRLDKNKIEESDVSHGQDMSQVDKIDEKTNLVTSDVYSTNLETRIDDVDSSKQSLEIVVDEKTESEKEKLDDTFKPISSKRADSLGLDPEHENVKKSGTSYASLVNSINRLNKNTSSTKTTGTKLKAIMQDNKQPNDDDVEIYSIETSSLLNNEKLTEEEGLNEPTEVSLDQSNVSLADVLESVSTDVKSTSMAEVKVDIEDKTAVKDVKSIIRDTKKDNENIVPTKNKLPHSTSSMELEPIAIASSKDAMPDKVSPKSPQDPKLMMIEVASFVNKLEEQVAKASMKLKTKLDETKIRLSQQAELLYADLTSQASNIENSITDLCINLSTKLEQTYQSSNEKVSDYIANQRYDLKHKAMSFDEELEKLLADSKISIIEQSKEMIEEFQQFLKIHNNSFNEFIETNKSTLNGSIDLIESELNTIESEYIGKLNQRLNRFQERISQEVESVIKSLERNVMSMSEEVSGSWFRASEQLNLNKADFEHTLNHYIKTSQTTVILIKQQILLEKLLPALAKYRDNVKENCESKFKEFNADLISLEKNQVNLFSNELANNIETFNENLDHFEKALDVYTQTQQSGYEEIFNSIALDLEETILELVSQIEEAHKNINSNDEMCKNLAKLNLSKEDPYLMAEKQLMASKIESLKNESNNKLNILVNKKCEDIDNLSTQLQLKLSNERKLATQNLKEASEEGLKKIRKAIAESFKEIQVARDKCYSE